MDSLISVSLGSISFTKITGHCLSELLTETSANLLHLREEFLENTTARNFESNQIVIHFIKEIKDLLQSRIDDPCAPDPPERWTTVEILWCAIAAGISLSVSLMVFLKFCSACCVYLDKFYVDPGHIVKLLTTRKRKKDAQRLLLQQNAGAEEVLSFGEQSKMAQNKVPATPSITIIDTPDVRLWEAAKKVEPELATDNYIFVKRAQSTVDITIDTCEENTKQVSLLRRNQNSAQQERENIYDELQISASRIDFNTGSAIDSSNPTEEDTSISTIKPPPIPPKAHCVHILPSKRPTYV